jgi:hypothetical protein
MSFRTQDLAFNHYRNKGFACNHLPAVVQFMGIGHLALFNNNNNT